MRVDHVGIAVRQLDVAVQTYTAAFGARLIHRETLDQEHVQVAFLDCGGLLLELLTPTSQEGPLSRSLEKRGEGLHHLAFEVPDLEQALRDTASTGLRPVDGRPRRGARGRRVAFMHPSGAHGVLIELVQS